jgi:hypothetical protein
MQEDDMEIIVAGSVFVGLFFAWVVLPSLLKRRHASRSEREVSE